MTTESATKTEAPKRGRKVYKIVSIRFTVAEHEAVSTAAEKANEKTATFVRRHALEAAK